MHLDAQLGWYYSFLFIFGVAFCFLFHAPMQRQGSSLLALMRPASTLEKWLHAACMLVVLFPLALHLCYLIATVPINALAALAESTRYRAEIAAATRPPLRSPLAFMCTCRFSPTLMRLATNDGLRWCTTGGI